MLTVTTSLKGPVPSLFWARMLNWYVVSGSKLGTTIQSWPPDTGMESQSCGPKRSLFSLDRSQGSQEVSGGTGEILKHDHFHTDGKSRLDDADKNKCTRVSILSCNLLCTFTFATGQVLSLMQHHLFFTMRPSRDGSIAHAALSFAFCSCIHSAAPDQQIKHNTPHMQHPISQTSMLSPSETVFLTNIATLVL